MCGNNIQISGNIPSWGHGGMKSHKKKKATKTTAPPKSALLIPKQSVPTTKPILQKGSILCLVAVGASRGGASGEGGGGKGLRSCGDGLFSVPSGGGGPKLKIGCGRAGRPDSYNKRFRQ